jgi:hypothetical protein
MGGRAATAAICYNRSAAAESPWADDAIFLRAYEFAEWHSILPEDAGQGVRSVVWDFGIQMHRNVVVMYQGVAVRQVSVQLPPLLSTRQRYVRTDYASGYKS